MRREIVRFRYPRVSTLAFLLVGGCLDGPSHRQVVIIDQIPTPPKPPTSVNDPNVAAILAAAQGRHSMEGTWRNGRQATVLTVDLVGGEMVGGGTMPGDPLLVGVTAHVTTRDGLIQTQETLLRFWEPTSASFSIPVDGLPDAYLHPTDDASLGSLGFGSEPAGAPTGMPPTLNVTIRRDGSDANLVGDDPRILALWSTAAETLPIRRPTPYAVPAELAAD
jgi:hypothetical protein